MPHGIPCLLTRYSTENTVDGMVGRATFVEMKWRPSMKCVIVLLLTSLQQCTIPSNLETCRRSLDRLASFTLLLTVSEATASLTGSLLDTHGTGDPIRWPPDR